MTRDGRPATEEEDGLPCDLLIDATGARCPLFADLGFSQQTMLKGARALGIVCHLRLAGEAWEAQLEEGNWANQFHQQRFGRLASEHGVALQNVVYYQQPNSSHYFVMTAEADSLLAHGALRSKDAESLVGAANVDLAALERFARLAIAEFVPGLATVPLLPKQLQIFDFSERRQSNAAARVLPAARFGGRPGNRLVVTRVGDALQEPFWPEGLGINRGFLHVLDCADLVQGYGSILRAHQGTTPQQPEDTVPGALTRRSTTIRDAVEGIVARREALFACVVPARPPSSCPPSRPSSYRANPGSNPHPCQHRCTKKVSGHNRKTELRPCLTRQKSSGPQTFAYSTDPHSRYTTLPLDVVMSAARLEERAAALVAALESTDGYAELKALYDRLDIDGDGELTAEEWSAGLEANQSILTKYFGDSVSSSDGGHLFRQIDTDGSGSLSWEEFCDGARALGNTLRQRRMTAENDSGG